MSWLFDVGFIILDYVQELHHKWNDIYCNINGMIFTILQYTFDSRTSFDIWKAYDRPPGLKPIEYLIWFFAVGLHSSNTWFDSLLLDFIKVFCKKNSIIWNDSFTIEIDRNLKVWFFGVYSVMSALFLVSFFCVKKVHYCTWNSSWISSNM